MTSQIFFWYVFPWLVSIFGGGWLIYDYFKNPQHRLWEPKSKKKKTRET